METKKCGGICGLDKSVNEYHKNPTKKDGLQSMCKECRKSYHRTHYLNNIDKYKLKTKTRRETILDWFIENKRKLICEKCGENRYWVLDFHHTDSQNKDMDISKMIRGYGKEKIITEMNKCIVLCSNCHRDLHYTLYNCK